jgi:cell division protein FtsZ
MSDLIPSAKVMAIGIGSAGTRIVSFLSKESLLVEKFAYVSCDESDLASVGSGAKILIECPVEQKLTPAIVRGLAIKSDERLRGIIGDAKVVFVIAGLGGATGSGLSPMIASLAQECGATAVGVAVMPFDYEKKLKFHAGVSLKRLRQASRGVIVIDNDTMLRSSPDDSTLTEVYDMANREAVKALGSLLSNSSASTVPVGLNKLLGTVLQDGYTLLGMSSSASPDKAEEALAGAVVFLSKIAEAKEANRVVVMLTGDRSVPASEVGVAVKRLGSMMNNQMVDVEYGVNYSGTSQLQVSLLASGFKSTKYDEYDPLSKVLGDKTIDDEMDYSLQGVLDTLPTCE